MTGLLVGGWTPAVQDLCFTSGFYARTCSALKNVAAGRSAQDELLARLEESEASGKGALDTGWLLRFCAYIFISIITLNL